MKFKIRKVGVRLGMFCLTIASLLFGGMLIGKLVSADPMGEPTLPPETPDEDGG